MRVRYKKSGYITYSGSFNLNALNEVLTGDDSPFVSQLDVWLDKKQEWKDMGKAFTDHDLITDNWNTCFFEPENEEDKKLGYKL
jgi:hypothetical protein